MKKYYITFVVVREQIYEIEANSYKEAIKKGKLAFNQDKAGEFTDGVIEKVIASTLTQVRSLNHAA